MNQKPVWVNCREVMPARNTCCWVRLEGVEGVVPAMYDGQKWIFQVRGFEDHQVVRWRTNEKGCRWYVGR